MGMVEFIGKEEVRNIVCSKFDGLRNLVGRLSFFKVFFGSCN